MTWATMKVPDEGTLSAALRRLLATVVIGDSRATRTEDQLRELTHLMLIKLESDAVASRSGNADQPVAFQIRGDENNRVDVTAKMIREQFRSYYASQRTRIFHPDDRDEIYLTDETIYAVVGELYPFRLLGDDVDLLAKAFQIFRASALKLAGGQFLTPLRVIRPASPPSISGQAIRSSTRRAAPEGFWSRRCARCVIASSLIPLTTGGTSLSLPTTTCMAWTLITSASSSPGQ